MQGATALGPETFSSRAGPAASTAAPTRPITKSYRESVEQLSQSSLRKYYRAFHDIAWDAPENQLDRRDPRLALRPDSPLGASAWYRALAPELRAELGIEMACQVVKFGIGFESVLSRGLLEFAGTLENGRVEHRYALHEAIEECQHSLMFQELINRSGCDPQPVGRLNAFIDRRVVRSAATFPELFFCLVLSGELFIDADNRAHLRTVAHPLLRRVLQIHVTEEARHVRFAELFLRERVPQLSAGKLRFLCWALPIALRDAQRMMLIPTPRLVQRFTIPAEVLRSCYGRGSAHRAQVEAIAAPVFALLGSKGARLRVFA